MNEQIRGKAADAPDVVRFWQKAQANWFSQDSTFDHRFRERFLDLHIVAARGERDDWTGTSEGALALLILLDQFPRNAFRGTKRMYATDPMARHVARIALSNDYMTSVEVDLRVFFCLPFAHSEDANDQELSVSLNAQLGEPWLSHALGHQAIIHRFGRFPHRNSLLGRDTLPDEQNFLEQGGFSG